MKVKITRIDKSLPLPAYQTKGSVAFDIYTRVNSVINPGEAKILPANFIIEVPKGYFLLITPRSSLFKKGLQPANSVGIIDHDYCGPEDEVHISLRNFTTDKIEVKRGDRLAQGLVIPVEKADWEEVQKIKEVSRGGFGSTGT